MQLRGEAARGPAIVPVTSAVLNMPVRPAPTGVRAATIDAALSWGAVPLPNRRE